MQHHLGPQGLGLGDGGVQQGIWSWLSERRQIFMGRGIQPE
jgi:hypothetical protein